MTDAGSMTGLRRNSDAGGVLRAAARFWFVVAVFGQWTFACYVLFFYGGALLRGEPQAWNEVIHGFVAGDRAGNFAVAVHLLLAAVVLICGPLQFVPELRARAPAFHRWSGRFYLLAAFSIGTTGLYMLWTRGAVGDAVQHVGISLNAVLILLCAGMALRHALAREIKVHSRWALRLFFVMSGVWFFRVGLMFWLFVNRGPVGFDMHTFQGPFLSFLSFAQYLLPLAMFEIYRRVTERGDATDRLLLAGTLFLLTIAMSIGIFAATLGMWLPRMSEPLAVTTSIIAS